MKKYTCKGCIHLFELLKHPSNDKPFKGTIFETTNMFACTVPNEMEMGNKAIIQTKIGGGCELYYKK